MTSICFIKRSSVCGRSKPWVTTRIRNSPNAFSEYMQKAVHEAKAHTSWINPSPAYDHSVQTFVEGALARTPSNRFLEDFLPFRNAWRATACTTP